MSRSNSSPELLANLYRKPLRSGSPGKRYKILVYSGKNWEKNWKTGNTVDFKNGVALTFVRVWLSY